MPEYIYAVDDRYRKEPTVSQAEVIKETAKQIVIANHDRAAFDYKTHIPKSLPIFRSPAEAVAGKLLELRNERAELMTKLAALDAKIYAVENLKTCQTLEATSP